MRVLPRLALSTLVIGIFVGVVGEVNAAPESAAALSMCRGADGKIQTGEVDLLLLLDNSKSLNQKNGSDTSNQRYQAIEDMLNSVVGGLGSTNKVNFALTSFGTRITDAIAFGAEPLKNIDDASNLASLIEKKVPGDYKKQESTTDYVLALNHAYQLFETRPEDNCKILVWFTDGVFESRETRDRAAWKKQAGSLRSEICGGLANRFQSSRINTFALVLQPKNPDQSRLSASYGAMAALTGDQELPSTVKKAIKGGDDCGGGGLHLGEVLLATDASAIGRYMPGIANIASGAEQATEQCPVAGNELESLPLPAGRHLKWISVENIEGSALPSEDSITIRSSAGTDLGSASKYLKRLPSKSQYEMKLEIGPDARKELNAGWQIVIESGLQGLCMRAKAENFAMRFISSTSEGVQVELQGADEKSQIIEQDVPQMTFAKYSDTSGTTFSLVEAASLQDDVVALLPIDSTGKIFAQPLEVRIAKRDAAVISCVNGLSFLPWRGTMPGDKTAKTETCRVDVSGTGKTVESVAVDTKGPVSKQLSDCGIALAPDAQLSNGEVPAVPAKGSNNRIETAERSHLDIQVVASMGKTAKCSIDDVYLEVNLVSNAGQQTETIPVLVRFDLKKSASVPLVVLFTLLGIIAILIINLLGLNYLMRRLIKLPSVNDLKAIEIPLQLTRNQGGSISATVNGEPLTSFRPGQENLFNVVQGEGESISIQRGRTSLRMDRPGLLNPLGTPIVVVHPATPAVYTPNAGEYGGLAPTFKSAMVFHSVIPVDDKTVAGTLAIFIPMAGPDSGLRGIQSLLNDQSKIREISLRGIELGSEPATRTQKTELAVDSADFTAPVAEQSNRLPRMPGASE